MHGDMHLDRIVYHDFLFSTTTGCKRETVETRLKPR